MSIKYTDGARAFIYSLAVLTAITLAAISILIISIVDPTPRKITFNAPEFITTQKDNDFGCRFERALQVINVDDLAEWLITANSNAICLKKKSEEFWIVYALEELKNDIDF